MNEKFNSDDPKKKLPQELQRIPRFGGPKKNNGNQKKTYKPSNPIDYPSEKNLTQKLALSALKYSGTANIKSEIEDTARDLLEIGEENNFGLQKTQSNDLDQKNDMPPPPPMPCA